MNLHQLPKISATGKKRLGRGYGSRNGGHTSSRGQKGQKSRSSVPLWFEGGQLPFSRRLPFLRGKDRFKSLKPDTITLNLTQLNRFKAGTRITPEILVKEKLVTLAEAASGQIKLLGQGQLQVSLHVEGIPASASAIDQIKKAGGTYSPSPSKKSSS